MMNLGIVAQKSETYKQLKELLQTDNKSIYKIDKKSTLNQLNGLIVIMENKESFTKVISWLLACQMHQQIFVWVFSEISLKDEKKVMLDLGANDVITTMSSLSDLAIKVNNTFNRISYIINSKENNNLESLLNTNNQTICINGKDLFLTRQEFKLINILYQKKNVTVSYEELLNSLWNDSKRKANYMLANTVFHLREKVAKSNDFEIKTVRSKGYMLQLKK